MPGRVVGFGGLSVDIRCEGAVAQDIVDYLFAIAGSDPGSATIAQLSIEQDRDGQLTCSRDGIVQYRGDSVSAATGILLEMVCNLFGEHCTDGLVLHAGAVAANGTGFLLPGQSGRGKTSLTAWLLGRGYSYLTDELCYVKTGSDRLQGLARPLNLKASSLDVVGREMNVDTAAPETRKTGFATLFPPRMFGAAEVTSDCRIRAIVFPHYSPDAEPGLSPLPKSETAIGLLRTLINVHLLGSAAVTETNRLARDCPGYRLRYSSFSQIDDAFAQLLADVAA